MKMRIPPRNAVNGAFTLMELLVAISIVILLVVVLSPSAINGMREAESVKCIANLRQLGSAITTYTAEKGVFPPGGWIGGIPWVTETFPYTGNRSDVYFCPAGGKRGPNGEWAWNTFPAPAQKILYSMHYAYNAMLNGDGSPVPSGPRSPQGVRSLSHLPMVIDVVWQNNFYAFDGVFPREPTPKSGSSFATRHMNLGHVLWGDGSVTASSTQTLYDLQRQVGLMEFFRGDY
ncbi:prepilin-type processing-associated H-X9-DG domain-containing protein [Terrimicrobium sacchariphilum]|uniref:Prepilin-type processing-associated H-X9-DG domain-containing protein n=2 Tax=Terrimicrobium sacchariphilum TaxID=690879 RepID=A0A146G6P5_TERSA|nr:prepilin-type processing-associated H-X9-DG domain-containing protein [Terrimicrobium sacchariphilum]